MFILITTKVSLKYYVIVCWTVHACFINEDIHFFLLKVSEDIFQVNKIYQLLLYHVIKQDYIVKN